MIADFFDIEYTREIDVNNIAVERVYRYDFNYTPEVEGFIGSVENSEPSEAAEVEIITCEEECINGTWREVDYSEFEADLIEHALEHISNLQPDFVEPDGE